jgi:hypothetical protein
MADMRGSAKEKRDITLAIKIESIGSESIGSLMFCNPALFAEEEAL